MTLRRPAAHLRRAPGWRRSGDESCWEGLIPEREPSVSRTPCAPRPQSAIEGGQLDSWLEHLQAMQSRLEAPIHNQVPAFSDRTTSMPALDKEPTGRAWRQRGFPFFSRGSSSCGSSSVCESLLGSQESLQTGLFPPPERRGSWEKAHITQRPRKEQAELSNLAPVKIGWLPIQRRVMMVADACNQNQALDHSAGQMKLKQPITPTFQKSRATPKTQDCEVGRSHTSPGAWGLKGWLTPDQGSPIAKQEPERHSSPANDGDRPLGWQALRRGWNTKRVLAFPGGGKSNDLPTGTISDPNTKSTLVKTTSTEPLKHSPPHRAAPADPCGPHTPPRGTNTTETYKSHAPLQRTGSVQPIKATAPLWGANSATQPSHIQTSSAVTTLIPQNKTGFSSITISSRKVTRSASLPGSKNPSPRSSESPSPPPTGHQVTDPNPRQFTVQRKATIVKVTEKRVMSGPVPSTERTGPPPASHALDTVVRRRKATIIKVTEHRESYTPAKAGSRHPEYRHSFTEGVYKDSGAWSQESQNSAAPSYRHAGPNPAVNAEKNGTLHKSTLSLFLSSPPALAAPASSEVSPKAVGQRSDRPRRPLSCYGNVIGHTEPSKENVTEPAARKWSFGLPQETRINPVNPDSSFISPGKAVKEAGQLVADAGKPNERERLSPPVDVMRRASPCLTLIKAPDPHSRQSPEEVLALNAAAVIANIKLQRQLSQKKTAKDDSDKDSAASPQGNSVTDEEQWLKQHSDQSQVRRPPRAAAVHLNPDSERSAESITLQQALQRSRPEFISRSQGRVRELERRARERRELSGCVDPQLDVVLRQRRAHSAQSASLNGNLFRPRDRVITGKEMHPRSKHMPADVKRKREEEKKREVCLSNRQRVELFKKKLLDQVLQRSNS